MTQRQPQQPKVYQRDIIDSLVEARSISDNNIYSKKSIDDLEESGSEFRRYGRILDLLREQAIYHLNVTVRAGRGQTKRLSPESLNLTKAQANSIRANAGELGSIKVFRLMEGIAYQLSMQRQTIMRMTTNIGGIPVVPESQIDKVNKEIQKLKQLVEDSKEQVSMQYNKGFRDFLYRVTNIINDSDVPDDMYEPIIREYAKSFPSLGDILDQMYVIISGPYRIPSLLEDQQHDQHFLAQEMRKNMLEDIKSSFHSLRDAIFSSLVETLSDIEKKSKEDTVKSRSEARELLNKIEKITKKSNSIVENSILGSDTEDLKLLKYMILEIDLSTNQEQIQDAVDKIRSQFELKVQPYQKNNTFEEDVMENIDFSF